MFVDKSELKNIPIVNYLSSIGIKEVSVSGTEYRYLSPLTNERTPSFFVNAKENVFFDNSSGAKGDIISLVMALHRCSFKDALERLKSGEISRSFSFCGDSLEKANKLIVRKVLPLTNHNLILYVQNRGISFEIAARWLKEIHYSNNGKNYFSVGFKNDADGYELRNGLGFKAKTANGITTVNKNTTSINLFEGFFDYLSALQYYKTIEPSKTTIILNTTVNVNRFMEKYLPEHKVNCYLDNDKSGFRTFKRLVAFGYSSIKNQSAILYPDFKDFNDYLINPPKEVNPKCSISVG
jgi:hypothetical protein